MVQTKFRDELGRSDWKRVSLKQGMLEEPRDRQVVWGIDVGGKPRMAILIRQGDNVVGEFVDDCPLACDPVYGFRMFRLLSELRLINDNSMSSAFMAVVHLMARESKAAAAFEEHATRTQSFFETFRDSGVIDAAEIERIAVQVPLNLLDTACRLSSAGVLEMHGLVNEVNHGRLQLTPELKRLGVESSANLVTRRNLLEGQSAKYEQLFQEYLASRDHSGCACCAELFTSNMVSGLERGMEGAALVASSIVRYHQQHNIAAQLDSIKRRFGGASVSVLVIGGHAEDEEPFDLERTIQSIAKWVGTKMATNVASLTEELRTVLPTWNTMPIVVD